MLYSSRGTRREYTRGLGAKWYLKKIANYTPILILAFPSIPLNVKKSFRYIFHIFIIFIKITNFTQVN